jgi:hypothetical protein
METVNNRNLGFSLNPFTHRTAESKGFQVYLRRKSLISVLKEIEGE